MANVEPYNAESPEVSSEAGEMLLIRGIELLAEGGPVEQGVWGNLGFHVATVSMRELGLNYPVGPEAQSYIALVLAAWEHHQAGVKLVEAIR